MVDEGGVLNLTWQSSRISSTTWSVFQSTESSWRVDLQKQSDISISININQIQGNDNSEVYSPCRPH